MPLSAKILSLAMSAAELGVPITIKFLGDDDALRAVAELPRAEVMGIVSVEDGKEPRIAITADIRIGPLHRVWINASQHREATSAEMEAASSWDEQPGRRVGVLRRLP